MPYPKFSLHASLLLTALLVVLHGISLVIIALVTLAYWLKCLLATWVAVSAWCSITRQGLRSSSKAICACWLNQQAWHLLTRDNKLLRGQLLGCSFISPYVSVLNFSCAKSIIALTLMPDAMEPEAYRRLRVYLKLMAAKHTLS